MVKKAIFTYCNFQINPDIKQYQRMVIDKFIQNTDIEFKFLNYNAPDGELFPDDAIHYGLGTLYNEGYTNILILDIDCIPLSQEALLYTFEQSVNKVLIGNIQRSNYIQNDKHVFIGSSCLCIDKELHEQLDNVLFHPTKRGDIAEELTYKAEEYDKSIEFYVPDSFEALPAGGEAWPLREPYKDYGIGTTFVRQSDNKPMFYHLFESRTNLNVERFITKCRNVLEL